MLINNWTTDVQFRSTQASCFYLDRKWLNLEINVNKPPDCDLYFLSKTRTKFSPGRNKHVIRHRCHSVTNLFLEMFYVVGRSLLWHSPSRKSPEVRYLMIYLAMTLAFPSKSKIWKTYRFDMLALFLSVLFSAEKIRSITMCDIHLKSHSRLLQFA